MGIIPNKLSFIWVGKVIPHVHMKTILRWVVQNPLYECHLWIEAKNMDGTVQCALESMEQLPQGLGWEYVSATDGQYGRTLIWAGNDMLPRSLHISLVTTLPAISDPIILYEEIDAWANYGTASDILRIWVLHELGGVYMDIDIYPVEQPIPQGITAPKDILFALVEDDLLMNNLIACTRGFPRLKELCRAMDRSYGTEQELVTSGVRKYTEAAVERYGKVRRARERLPNIPDSEPNEQRVWRLELMENLGVAFDRTGYLQIMKWIAEVEGDVGTDVDTGTPYILHEAVRILYTFQKQAGYCPELGSLTSWVK